MYYNALYPLITLYNALYMKALSSVTEIFCNIIKVLRPCWIKYYIA